MKQLYLLTLAACFVFLWPPILTYFGDDLKHHAINWLQRCRDAGVEIFLAKRNNGPLDGKTVILGYAPFEQVARDHLDTTRFSTNEKVDLEPVFIRFDYQNLEGMVNALKGLSQDNVHSVILEFNTSVWTNYTHQNVPSQKFIEKYYEDKNFYCKNVSQCQYGATRRDRHSKGGQLFEFQTIHTSKNIHSASFVVDHGSRLVEAQLDSLSKLSERMNITWIVNSKYFKDEIIALPDTYRALNEFIHDNDSHFGNFVLR